MSDNNKFDLTLVEITWDIFVKARPSLQMRSAILSELAHSILVEGTHCSSDQCAGLQINARPLAQKGK